VNEVKKFSENMPKLAEVLIHERDEYLAQSILESLRLASTTFRGRKCRLVAVIGLGHLQGVQRVLASGGSSTGRLAVISSSSKHLAPTWPEDGGVRILSSEICKN
jgi:pheromone shutdown protein TraB